MKTFTFWHRTELNCCRFKFKCFVKWEQWFYFRWQAGRQKVEHERIRHVGRSFNFALISVYIFRIHKIFNGHYETRLQREIELNLFQAINRCSIIYNAFGNGNRVMVMGVNCNSTQELGSTYLKFILRDLHNHNLKIIEYPRISTRCITYLFSYFIKGMVTQVYSSSSSI